VIWVTDTTAASNRDPVLPKNGARNSITITSVSHPGDALSESSPKQFFSAMKKAMEYARKGEYSTAAIKYREAVAYARNRWDLERCLVLWRQVFNNAHFNNPNDDPISKGWVAAEKEYETLMRALADTSSKSWMKYTAMELLAANHLRKREDEKALALYEYLSKLVSDEPLIAKRAMTNLEIVLHHGFGNWNGAYKVYEKLKNNYSGTYAVVFAKIDLGLPLTEADGQIMKNPSRSASKKYFLENPVNKPVEFVLRQCYPNPFNPVTVIKYGLPKDSKTKLTVYDQRGALVKTLVDEVESAGYYMVRFDGSNLASGMYIYRLEVEALEDGETRSISKKMILSK